MPLLPPFAATALSATLLTAASAVLLSPPLLADASSPVAVNSQVQRASLTTMGEQEPPGTAPLAGAVTRAAAGRTRWLWPLAPTPRLVRPFVAPRTRFGPGHRGIDLAGDSGASVLAVADGAVQHVGVVAGRGTVTVLHRDGVRSTYEPVEPTARVDAVVAAGDPLGRLSGPGHCEPSTCLHLGALRGTDYLDPMLFLRPVRVRPLPLSPS